MKTDSPKTQEIMGLFQDAEEYRRPYERREIDCYKLYRGFRPELPEEFAGRSNLHIPMAYEHVDTWRSRLLKNFFGPNRPWVEFIPQPREGVDINQSEKKAQIAAAVNDMQLERNKASTLFYDWFTCLLYAPAVIASVGWRKETVVRKKKQPTNFMGMFDLPFLRTVEEEEHVWDDNEIQVVDFHDFWPDPRGTDIDTCRYVFQREWGTQREIEAKLDLLEAAGTGTVTRPDWEDLKSITSLDEGRFQRMSSVGLGVKSPISADKKFPPFEMLHYWTDEEHVIILNRQVIVYEGENPYWHGRKPFARGVFEPIPHEFYGMSAVGIIEHLQHELNTTRNQRIDNVSLVLNRMFKAREGADIDESQLISRPNGIVWVTDMNDVVPFEVPDITSSGYNEEMKIRQDAENALAVPAVIRGVDSSANETATETTLKSSNASIRFDTKMILFEDMGISRIMYLMDQNSQQFMTEPRLIKLFDDEDAAQWQMADPSDIIGEWDYRPAGAATDPASNKEIRRQQLMQLAEYAMKTQSQNIKIEEIEKELVKSFDLRNPEKFIKTEEEKQQEMMEQQQAQQLAAQQQQAQGNREMGQEVLKKAIDKAIEGQGMPM